jgi:hypothetical protein
MFRIGPGSVMNAISRKSPPHPGHCSGSSSPARAISFAHAIRDTRTESGEVNTTQRRLFRSPCVAVFNRRQQSIVR